ncbi:NADH-quinone oxidoreductase subunit C [Rudanella paleaurantiibacter]|uniref:NADH-quinone oxidoreductase subunit C n=1 Tax=Rudanella paleaurantiibacter TaxID=2614655 RepID=A0A7J5U2K6_9BACT|nr:MULTISPECIES: NADH-quinone oxidoreductase subunit C [Rudanella]KAB7731868.1 NADH-quinone oxidoreductase subunit C [Rudanella paleaurantiibacter]
MLTNETVAQDIIQQFGDAVSDFDDPFDLLTLTVTREQLIPLLQYLKDHKTFQISFLTDITAVHYPDSPGREFCVVYHAHSLINNYRIRLKVYLSNEDLHVPTATVLYESANWMERETFDYFGILFDGHPKLERILNMEEMDYHPMRKEYPLEDGTRRDKIDALFGR